MARPRYIREEEEEKQKQQAAISAAQNQKKESETISFKSDAGAAAKPQSTGAGAAGQREYKFIYEKKNVDLDQLTQKRATSMAATMKTGQERLDFLTAYREHISSKKSANYQKNAPEVSELMKEANARRNVVAGRTSSQTAAAGSDMNEAPEEKKGWFAQQWANITSGFSGDKEAEKKEAAPEEKREEAQETREEGEPPAPTQTISENWEETPQAETGLAFSGRKSGSVDLTGDLGKAISYVQGGRMDELTGETQAALDKVMEIPGAREWLGMLGEDEFDQFAYTNPDGTTGQEKNNVGVEYLYLESRGRLGYSLGQIAAKIADDDFPQDIREDAMMAGLQLLEEIDAWQESGAYAQEVAEPANPYEMYIQLHGGESDSVRALSLALDYAGERKAQEKEARRLAAEQEEKNRAQQLDDARSAVRSGSYTAEQMSLVMENAPDMSEEARMQDSLYAELRGQMNVEWDYSQSEWMDAQVLDMAAAAHGDDTLNPNMEWMYRTVAQGFLEEALGNRIDAAYALGYGSLEEYAAAHGGLTLESLHQDARLAMIKYGRGLDAQTVALAQSAALDMEEGSRYTGTGENANALDIGFGATMHALTGTAGEYLETFYNIAASTDLERDSARIRATYDNDYGLYGATQYAADIRAMAEGGYFPSEEMASYAVAYLDAGGSPYDLGIMPEDMNFIRRSAVTMKQTAQDYQNWASENLTQGQGLAFDILSNSESNLYRQVVAAAVSRTGGAFAGSMIGYGAGGTYNEAFSQSLAQSAKSIRETGVVPGTSGLAWANVDGMAQATAMAVANMDTLSKWTGNVLGMFGVSSAAKNGLTKAGEAGTMRLLSGAAKLVKGIAKQELDEVILDELKEGWLAEGASGFTDTWRQAVESGTASPTTALYAAVQGIGRMITSAGEVAKDTAQAAPMGFLYMLPLSVLGAAGELKADMPKTVKAAQTAAKTGRAEDVAAVATTMREELETATPEQQKRVNAAFENQMVTEEAAGVLLNDAEIAQKNVLAAKADEQIASHKENLAASQESWQAGYDAALDAQERMNAGEVDPTLIPQLEAGLEGMDKAETGIAELEREIAQKTQESNRLHTQALSEAVSKARKTVGERQKAAKENSANVYNDLSVMGEDFDLSRNMNAIGYANEPGQFEQALDAWDGEQGDLSFVVSKTPAVLRTLGIEEGDVVLQSDKLAKIKKKHPQMSDEVIKQLPGIISDPVVVMQSNTVKDRVTLFGEVLDEEGAPVLAVISLSPKSNMVTGANFFELNSAYGKNTDPQGFINRSKILYIDKKRAPAWEVSTRLQLPVEPSAADSSSTSIVPQNGENVKGERKIQADALPGGAGRENQQAPYTGMDGGTITPTAEKGKLKTNPVRVFKRLARDLGIGQAIGTRKLNGLENRAAGYYQMGTRYVATGTRFASSAEVAGHEIGHAIADRLGITGTPEMVNQLTDRFTGNYSAAELQGEAFAEFFWRYMVSDEAGRNFAGNAYVANFERLMRQNGMYRNVMRAKRELRQYLNAETDERIGQMIRDKSDKKKDQSLAEFFDDAQRKFVTAMVDSTRPAEDVNEAVRAQSENRRIQERMNLRHAALMQSTAPRRAWNILTGNLTDVQGTIIGDSLKARFERAGITGKEFDLLNEYMLAKHSLDRDRQGKPVFDRQSITQVDTRAFIEQTERDHPEVMEAAKAFQAFRHDFMTAYMVRTGYMTEADLSLMEQMYPNYVPTYRVKDRGRRGAGGQTYEIRRATGSTEEIINPMDSFVEMVNTIVAMNLRNETAKTWDRVYREYDGMGIFGREVDEDTRTEIISMRATQRRVRETLENAGAGEDMIQQVLDTIGEEQPRTTGMGEVNLPNVLSVQLPNGDVRFYEMYDTELFDMIAGTQDSGKSIFGWLAHLTRGMSMLTTGSNPVFALRNFMRDYQNSVNYGSWAGNYVTGIGKWLGAAKDVAIAGYIGQKIQSSGMGQWLGEAFNLWKGSATYEQYAALGGGGWTQVNPQSKKGADEYRGELFSGYSTSNIGRTAKWAGRKIWNGVTLARLNEIVEQTSRYAEYKYGKHDRSTAEGRQEAYLAAQDVTTDFSRRGASRAAKEMKAIVPFFNASLQGIYRTGRQATEAESDRAGTRFIKTVINTGIASALASAAMLACLDEEEQEEFFWLSDDLKAKHLYLPNFAPEALGETPLIRIPLAQDPLSYAVHAIVTNTMWSGEGEEWAIGLCAIADNLMNSFNPISSTTLDPIIAMSTNKNWYGSNIVPRSMEGWYPTTQYSEETPEMFITMAKGIDWLGPAVSPMMLQYIAEQYTGYVGQMVIPYFSRNKYTGEIQGMNAVIDDVRRTLTSDPLVSSGIVSTVYDNVEFLTYVTKAFSNNRQMDMLRDGLTQAQKQAAYDEAYEMTHKGGVLYETKKLVTNGYAEIEEIEGNESLTEEQKYDMTSRVRREMIEAALDANEAMEAYRQSYVTGTDFISRWMYNLANK